MDEKTLEMISASLKSVKDRLDEAAAKSVKGQSVLFELSRAVTSLEAAQRGICLLRTNL